MKLISAKINNYKSFGEQENLLYVDNLNAVVGKNESGKSNLIEALADVGFIGIDSPEMFDKKNRKSHKDIKLELVFKTMENENFIYDDYKGNVVLTFEKGVCKINKEFGDYIVNLEQYKETLEKILLAIEIAPISKSENLQKISVIMEKIQKVNEELFIEPYFYEEFARSLKTVNDNRIKELLSLFEEMFNLLDNIYLNFPEFIKIENISLKNRYSIEDLKNELEEYNSKSILYQLFNVSKIDSKELISVMEEKQIASIRECADKIQNSINTEFLKKFNDFYKQEEIKVAVDIKEDRLDVIVKSDTGAYLDYSERSNGLRWYVSVAIQLLFKTKTNSGFSNSVLLLDEPGVHLHANAQQELRRLFEDMASKGCQIIYTTHSPFMLNKDNWLVVRAIIKDEEGYSHIYNKVTTIPIKYKSRYETITPVLYALGCNEAYDIGSARTICNIITEGITDYYCLIGYSECIQYKLPYNIIPGNGADTIIPIANILFGWGHKFIILLDNDGGGKGVYDKLKATNSPFIDRVVFCNGSKVYDKSIKFAMENVFSEKDRVKYGFDKPEYEAHKYNYVTDMLVKIKCKDDAYDEETINKFSALLEKIDRMESEYESK